MLRTLFFHNRFSGIKKIVALASVLFLSAQSFSQCAISSEPGSNAIAYNEDAIEKVIGLSKYDAFFYGERHSYHFEPEFKFHFIQHLHSKFGVRHVFMEVGVAAAYFFNKYLETGDSDYINIRMPYNWKYARALWENLYNYNKMLPVGNRLVIHGVDFERGEIFKLLHRLKVPGRPSPEELAGLFSQIEALSANDSLFFTDTEFLYQLMKIRTEFLRHDKVLKHYYGENYPVIKAAVENYTPATQRVVPRNNAWVETMEKIIVEEKITKFVAFFGKGHVARSHDSAPNVALQKRGYFSGKVVTIHATYSHFAHRGAKNNIDEYLHKSEKKLFEKYYDPRCRAVIVPGIDISAKFLRSHADFLLLARDVVY